MTTDVYGRTGPTAGTYRSCLLIAQEHRLTAAFTRALNAAGIAVLRREPGPSALTAALTCEFDLVAWVCGPSVAIDGAALRAMARHKTRLIALSDDASPEGVSSAFDAGADACMRLDADPRVMTAQVEAILRGQNLEAGPGEMPFGIGNLLVDVGRCEVLRGGVAVPLTPTEFRIIEFMARRPGQLLQSQEILNAVSDDYRYLASEANDVFKVYARRIRKKLEPSMAAPAYLVNVRGFGYRLEGGLTAAPRALAR